MVPRCFAKTAHANMASDLGITDMPGLIRAFQWAVLGLSYRRVGVQTLERGKTPWTALRICNEAYRTQQRVRFVLMIPQSVKSA